MMITVNVVVLGRRDRLGAWALSGLAGNLSQSLQKSGVSARLSETLSFQDEVNIVFGAHHCDVQTLIRIPGGSIVVNTKELGAGDPLLEALAAQSHTVTIWDHLETNLLRWRLRGVPAVKFPRYWLSMDQARDSIASAVGANVLIVGGEKDNLDVWTRDLEAAGFSVQTLERLRRKEFSGAPSNIQLIVDICSKEQQVGLLEYSPFIASGTPVVKVGVPEQAGKEWLDAVPVLGINVARPQCIELLRRPELIGQILDEERQQLGVVDIRETLLKLWQETLRLDRQREALGTTTPAVAESHGGSARAFPGAGSRASDDRPDFSVIITTFNRPDFLLDALGSVLGQTHKSYEVIVVNDHGTPVEVTAISNEAPVTYVRLGRNSGLSAARNMGIRVARGRDVCFLDDDDLFEPHHLACMAEARAKHGSNSFLYTDAVYVKEVVVDRRRVERSRSEPYAHTGFSKEYLLKENYIPVNSWCVPRAIFSDVGYFDTDLPALEDWEMLLRISNSLEVHHIPTKSVQVRQRGEHGDGMSIEQRRKFPALFRRIYSFHPTSNPVVLRERTRMLDMLDAEVRAAQSVQLMAING